MSIERWFGGGAGVVAAAVAVMACSSSSGSSGAAPVDAGVTRLPDAAPSSYDGTSGQACTTDGQCRPIGGAGVNVCSSAYTLPAAGVQINPWPTPLCVVPLPPSGSAGNCDPAPSSDPTGQFIHFCDGPDDPSTAAGVCVPPPGSGNPAPNSGTCLPLCTFESGGAAPAGCPGKDTCVPLSYLPDGTTQVEGLGFCYGSCQADADCSALGATFVCQTDLGFCTANKVARTKAIGDACIAADFDSGACNCEASATTGAGYCTSQCVVGGASCPNGWVCDTFQLSTVDLGNGQTTTATQNAGLAGQCAQSCETVADGGATDSGTVADGGACPPNSSCIDETTGGPDCLVP